MKQIDKYNLLELFHKDDQQSVYMAINREKESEIALVNEIKRNQLMPDFIFEELVRNLTNVSFYELGSELVLATIYNEGTPLKTYLDNYQPDNQTRFNMMYELLLKCSDYDSLPGNYKSILIDPQQMVYKNDHILLNEVILLKDLENASNFHDKLRNLFYLLLDELDSPKAHAILDYVDSDEFTETALIKDIFKKYRNLYNDAAQVQEKDEHLTAFVPVGIDLDSDEEELASFDEPLDSYEEDLDSFEEPFESDEEDTEASAGQDEPDAEDEDVTSTVLPIPPTELDDFLDDSSAEPDRGEIRAEPDYFTEHRKALAERSLTEEKKEKRKTPWLLLLLIPLIFLIFWFIFYTPEEDPGIAVDFEVVPFTNGWMFNNKTSTAEDTTIKRYLWSVTKDGVIIETFETEQAIFQPTENGEYTITLVIIDSNDRMSESFSKTLMYDGFKESDDGEVEGGDGTSEEVTPIPEDTKAGDVYPDESTSKTGKASVRITDPSDKFYPVLSLSNIFVSSGDIASMWIKTSDNKSVELKLLGYKDGTLITDYTFTHEPSLADFELVTFTFDYSGADKVVLEIKSDNKYVWVDSLIVETIK